MYLERDVSDSRTGGAPFRYGGSQKVRELSDMSDCPTYKGRLAITRTICPALTEEKSPVGAHTSIESLAEGKRRQAEGPA